MNEKFKCPCAGDRFFEPLDEPKENGMRWYVCPCCGTRKQFGDYLPLSLDIPEEPQP